MGVTREALERALGGAARTARGALHPTVLPTPIVRPGLPVATATRWSHTTAARPAIASSVSSSTAEKVEAQKSKLLRASAESAARLKIHFEAQHGADYRTIGNGTWKQYSPIHQSVINAATIATDVASKMEPVTGPLQLSDTIWPMGVQQGGTLGASLAGAKKGLFRKPESIVAVVSEFAEPLVQVFSHQPPPQWRVALEGGATSFAYPSFNTIWHGTTVHINQDISNALQLRHARKDPEVAVDDWVSGWCTVVGSGEQTSQILLRTSGPTSWTATAPLLDTRLGSLIRVTRDRPYIEYANAEGIDLSEHMESHAVGLLKPPSVELTEEFRRIIRELRLNEEWLEEYHKIEREFRSNARQL